jgi:hypothetical protein
MNKFLQAKDFYIASGHFMILPSCNVPRDLVSWVQVQRIKLKHKTNLSEVQLERRNMLWAIGFLSGIYDKQIDFPIFGNIIVTKYMFTTINYKTC